MPSANKPVAGAETCSVLGLEMFGSDTVIGGRPRNQGRACLRSPPSGMHIWINSNGLARGAFSATVAVLSTARTASRSGRGRGMTTYRMTRQDIAFVPMHRGGDRGSTTGPRHGMGLGAPTPRPGSLHNKPSTDRQPRIPIGASCPVSTGLPGLPPPSKHPQGTVHCAQFQSDRRSQTEPEEHQM
jgi:hypothetical protein